MNSKIAEVAFNPNVFEHIVIQNSVYSMYEFLNTFVNVPKKLFRKR